MVVDDDPMVLNFVSEYLKHYGHDVVALRDGESIVKTLGEKKCDAMVLDIRLNGEDGLKFIPQILEKQPGMPIVIFTGMGYEESHMKRAMELGARGYVSKLLPPDELYSALIRSFGSAKSKTASA